MKKIVRNKQCDNCLKIFPENTGICDNCGSVKFVFLELKSECQNDKIDSKNEKKAMEVDSEIEMEIVADGEIIKNGEVIDEKFSKEEIDELLDNSENENSLKITEDEKLGEKDLPKIKKNKK